MRSAVRPGIGALAVAVSLLTGIGPSVAGAQDVGSVPAAWGDGSRGQTAVPPDLTDVVDVAAGQDHSLALTADGRVVAWGDDTFGEATVPPDLPPAVDIAAGANHSLALTADGEVVGWGDSSTGQASPPADLTDVIQVAAGGSWSMALRTDGTVVAWGDNLFGQQEVPDGLAGVTSIAAGVYHGLALLEDTTVAMWGGYETLPRAVGPDSVVPEGLTGVTAIAGGENHSLALVADGTIVAWGAQGRIGTPDGLSGVTRIAAGWMHSLALRADGTVVAWLSPETTRDGFLEDRGQAVVPPGLQGVTGLAGGRTHSVAVVVPSPPTVIQQPVDVSATPGQPVTFSVTWSGFPAATVQWERSADGVTFEPIDGATEPGYSFVAQIGDDGAAFRAVLTNSAGTVASESAQLSVFLLPETGSSHIGLVLTACSLLAAGAVLHGIGRRRTT